MESGHVKRRDEGHMQRRIKVYGKVKGEGRTGQDRVKNDIHNHSGDSRRWEKPRAKTMFKGTYYCTAGHPIW